MLSASTWSSVIVPAVFYAHPKAFDVCCRNLAQVVCAASGLGLNESKEDNVLESIVYRSHCTRGVTALSRDGGGGGETAGGENGGPERMGGWGARSSVVDGTWHARPRGLAGW